MNKNIYKLVEVLVKSDFLSLESGSKVIAKNGLSYTFSDPFDISRSIKEFLKSLRDLKRRGKKMNVNIYVEDSFKKSFLEMCFMEANVARNVNVISSMKDIQKLSKDNQLLIVLGNPEESTYKSLLLKKFYRFHVINNHTYQSVNGGYVFHSSMSDMKKLVFLALLILKIVKF
jgi:hypothetical protein